MMKSNIAVHLTACSSRPVTAALGVIVTLGIEMDYRIDKNVPWGSVGCGRNDKLELSFNF